MGWLIRLLEWTVSNGLVDYNYKDMPLEQGFGTDRPLSRLVQPGHWKELTTCPRCDPEEYGVCNSGCNGGLMPTQGSGFQREEDYPYTGNDHGLCKLDKSKIVASVSNFSLIFLDESQMAANLNYDYALGMLCAVGINALYMQTYFKGVSCPYICLKHLNHGVLVGYVSPGYAPIRFKEKPFWIIKNSWGDNCGEDKYYNIRSARSATSAG
ncbi:hypothetical protein SAY86_006758 [Trapa natans]|uniref:Peptidase C1A papain C-terminal domain-containing protein n=1 Tax=Trapa natans TaxID=22666 RepID=A0AAN7LCQ5_TRANT|nr:hypothetical protein SAY86_006758 [Trapa natans]